MSALKKKRTLDLGWVAPLSSIAPKRLLLNSKFLKEALPFKAAWILLDSCLLLKVYKYNSTPFACMQILGDTIAWIFHTTCNFKSCSI